MNRHVLTSLVLVIAAAISFGERTAAVPAFEIEETTIAKVHAAMRAKTLSCRALVESYLSRIEAYDKKGPALNAILVINPEVLAEADAIDRKFTTGGLTGPLHCVPTVVKDNLETIGMPSSAGSLALKGFTSTKDATVVKRMKAAGALVLAKTNMAEFGLNPLNTVSSLGGATRNPFALDRVTAGSSGGTAAAVAANFALVGIGTDTGSSIRGPAAHNSLVGLRPTMGLTSRAGMIPTNYLSDVTGPLARTVEDAVAVLQVIAGEDSADPMTALAKGKTIPIYAKSLRADGLKGARIGILRQAYESRDLVIDDEIEREFNRALQAMTGAGATLFDNVHVEQTPKEPGAELCRGIKYDLNEYLAKQGARAPMHSFEEIIRSGLFDPSVKDELLDAQNSVEDGPGSLSCIANAEYRRKFTAALLRAMDNGRLDALVYPTFSQPPQLMRNVSQQGAGQSLQFATVAGFPALSVPMGVTRGVLPAGLSMMGRPWSEATLLRIAYAFEQTTHHRRVPLTTPPLPK